MNAIAAVRSRITEFGTPDNRNGCQVDPDLCYQAVWDDPSVLPMFPAIRPLYLSHT